MNMKHILVKTSLLSVLAFYSSSLHCGAGSQLPDITVPKIQFEITNNTGIDLSLKTFFPFEEKNVPLEHERTTQLSLSPMPWVNGADLLMSLWSGEKILGSIRVNFEFSPNVDFYSKATATVKLENPSIDVTKRIEVETQKEHFKVTINLEIEGRESELDFQAIGEVEN